jgi:PIN domain nuclease of toxin-antitoxin system
VKVLLDTHVFLWALTDPERIGEHLAVVEDRRNQIFLSAASSWEIAVKVRIGRLELPEAPARYVPDRMKAIGALGLAVEHAHALEVAAIPLLHRDPFDRLLVAQARLLDLVIATADSAIVQYPVKTLLVGAGP